MSIVTYENVGTPVFEIDYLRYIFSGGESGLLLSYLPGHLYADVDKTVPATIGGGVASFDDLSGNAVTGPQPVSTARPVLGRVPAGGRRNLLEYSEDFTNSKWVKNFSSIVLAPEESPPFGTAHKHVEEADAAGAKILSQSTLALTEGVRYTSFRVVKAGERTRIRGQLFRGSPVAQTDFNLVTGEVIGTSYGEGGIVDLGAGWYLCWISGVAAESNFYTDRFYPMDGTSTGYPGVEGSGYYIAAAQSTEGSEVLHYQRVTTQFDITESGVPSVHYARYDLADDVLPHNATLPAITDGTVILIGQQGIWIDDGYSFAGGNWRFGPSTYTGGPDGIIGVVGDMLDIVVLDRPLTADERDRVVAYGKRRGSAGLFELGPELVVNGDFSDGLNGWTAFLDGGGGPIPGGLRLEFSSSNARVQQAGIILPNELYYGSFRILSSDSNGVTRIKTNLGNDVSATLVASPSGSPPGVYAGVGFSNTSNISVFAGGGRPLSVDITDVSIRKLELVT